MINPQNKRTKRAAFNGGNIEWNQIPRLGDVYDFGNFWAYRVKGKWFVACWGSLFALEAQRYLAKLAVTTQKRLAKTNH